MRVAKRLECDRPIAYAGVALIIWIRLDMVYEDAAHHIDRFGP